MQHGFSLIELMIAVALMGLLLSAGVSSFRDWIQNSRIRNAAESILNGLQVARMEAVRHNAPVQFVFGVGSGWSVGCQTVTANCPALIQNRALSEGSSGDITVVASDGGTIIFDAFGRMRSPAPAGGVASFDIDNAAMSPADSRELRITVDVGGNTRMCDPNVNDVTDSRRC